MTNAATRPAMSKTKATNRRGTRDDACPGTAVLRGSAKCITFLEEKDLGQVFNISAKRSKLLQNCFYVLDLGKNAMTTHARFVYKSYHRDVLPYSLFESTSTNPRPRFIESELQILWDSVVMESWAGPLPAKACGQLASWPARIRSLLPLGEAMHH